MVMILITIVKMNMIIKYKLIMIGHECIFLREAG